MFLLLSFLRVPDPKTFRRGQKFKSRKSKEKTKMKRCYLYSTGSCMGRNASMLQGRPIVASNSLDIQGIKHFKGKTQGLCKKYVIT